METVHVMRTEAGMTNADVARALIASLSRANVEQVDADRAHVVAALNWSMASSAPRIRDATLASTASQARCEWIATFDESFASPTVPSRRL
jgi:predicted nucleic acid-binding protein